MRYSVRGVTPASLWEVGRMDWRGRETGGRDAQYLGGQLSNLGSSVVGLDLGTAVRREREGEVRRHAKVTNKDWILRLLSSELEGF